MVRGSCACLSVEPYILVLFSYMHPGVDSRRLCQELGSVGPTWASFSLAAVDFVWCCYQDQVQTFWYEYGVQSEGRTFLLHSARVLCGTACKMSGTLPLNSHCSANRFNCPIVLGKRELGRVSNCFMHMVRTEDLAPSSAKVRLFVVAGSHCCPISPPDVKMLRPSKALRRSILL